MFRILSPTLHTRGGTQKPWNLFINHCVFILTRLNFSPLQSTLHVMQCTYWDFFPLLRTGLNPSISIPSSTSAIFCFTSFTSAKRFSLRTFFHWGNKKSRLGWDRVNRKGGAGGHAVFVQKLLNTQRDVGRCAGKSPIMKWANTLKESSKNSPKLNAASHNNTS